MNQKIEHLNGVEIQKVENKLSTGGKKFCRIGTDQGWFTCWDDKICQLAADNLQKNVNLGFSTKDGDNGSTFKTIKEMEIDLQNNAQIVKPQELLKPKEDIRKFNSIPTSILVSYAKDIFIGLASRTLMEDWKDTTLEKKREIMHEAVALVKEAIEGFEEA